MTPEQPYHCDRCDTTFYSIIPITECIHCSQKELSDLKAKYIKEGRESCLREVKARVGSVECLEDENHTNASYFRGFNDCLDEIKKLIENI